MTGVPFVKGQILFGERNHTAPLLFQSFRRTLRSHGDTPFQDASILFAGMTWVEVNTVYNKGSKI